MKGTRDFNASLVIIATLLVGCVTTAFAQSQQVKVPTTVIVPPSSIAKPGDAGKRAHTNIRFLDSGRMSGTPQAYGPPVAGYFYETPASIACIYDLQPPVPGCNPNVVTANPIGGSRAIAIVDAYDHPEASSDLETFDSQFGVAAPPSFTVVYAPYGNASPPLGIGTGTPGSCLTTPPGPQPQSGSGTGWDIEESLDIEYSHAMAPSATLYLVEAQSDSWSDLLCAETTASGLVAAKGGGEVSNSWGTGEFSGETAIDPVFTKPTVVYFASAGDSPGVLYPSASPNVVSAGGTTLSTNATTGNFELENTWQNTGGFTSAYESRPSYQNGIAYLVGAYRGTPDVAADANPYTGVWVYNTTYEPPYVWWIVGGTSVSSPTWAGIVNRAGSFSTSSNVELTKMYGSFPVGFFDITQGDCGPYLPYSDVTGSLALPGWDFCSGLGSPRTYSGK